VVAVGRLYGGGVATAFVAALIAGVGSLICGEVLGLKPVEPEYLLPIGEMFVLRYAATAFVLALVATVLAHLLAVTTPRPRSFFRWIVGLAIGSLLTAVAGAHRNRPGPVLAAALTSPAPSAAGV